MSADSDQGWDSEPEELVEDPGTELVVGMGLDGGAFSPTVPMEIPTSGRMDQIRESHALLKQFTTTELRILCDLKRNTSPKAWTLREDLVILTLSLSNREISDLLRHRNKEAVKKRLQLLRSKGLMKRPTEAGTPEPPEAQVNPGQQQ